MKLLYLFLSEPKCQLQVHFLVVSFQIEWKLYSRAEESKVNKVTQANTPTDQLPADASDTEMTTEAASNNDSVLEASNDTGDGKAAEEREPVPGTSAASDAFELPGTVCDGDGEFNVGAKSSIAAGGCISKNGMKKSRKRKSKAIKHKQQRKSREEKYPCHVCKWNYGSPKDPKIHDDWIPCTSCQRYLHLTCV